MKKLAFVLALASAFAATNAHAWGNDGHRAVGAIADKLLKGSNAQKQLAAILFPGPFQQQVSKKGETYYTWALEVPQDYPVPSSALARTQLIKGGYNLAAVLTAIWP